MQLKDKRDYVLANLNKVPKDQLDLFNFNFACVFTRNSVTMENPDGKIPLEEVVSILKGLRSRVDGDIQRNIYNHYQTYLFILEKANADQSINEEFIKDVHETLMNKIMPGGLYRNVDIRINYSKHTPPTYLKIYDRMAKYIYQLDNFNGSDIELFAYTYLALAKIHPFLDGNGRVARLILNYQLLKHNYLPISIPYKNLKQYYHAIEEYKVNKSSKEFEALLEELLSKEYDRLITLINKNS